MNQPERLPSGHCEARAQKPILVSRRHAIAPSGPRPRPERQRSLQPKQQRETTSSPDAQSLLQFATSRNGSVYFVFPSSRARLGRAGERRRRDGVPRIAERILPPRCAERPRDVTEMRAGSEETPPYRVSSLASPTSRCPHTIDTSTHALPRGKLVRQIRSHQSHRACR
jgi:hypothetical protein